MLNIIGLDLSLTATGIACEHACEVLKPPKTVWPPKAEDRGRYADMERLSWIRRTIKHWLVSDNPPLGTKLCTADLIAIEGYSFGSSTGQARAIGELGGIVRYMLWTLCVPYVDVPPSSLKLFLTGKGTASKDDMVATAARLGCPANDNNCVDAWALRQMGMYADGLARGFDVGVVPLTAYRNRACEAIDWPELVAS